MIKDIIDNEYLKYYITKCFKMYILNILRWINRHVLKTYPSIEDCARCGDCGRNVNDFHVPNDIWFKVIGKPEGVYCYDCFCNRANKKNIFWGLHLVYKDLYKK